MDIASPEDEVACEASQPHMSVQQSSTCCASHSITCIQSTIFYFHTFSLQAAINDRVQSVSVQPLSTDLVS